MSLLDETSFENCIKCTVCTTVCPVSRVNPDYPGPKQSGPDGERLRGPAKTIARKRALSQRALADLDRWIAGDAFPAAAE